MAFFVAVLLVVIIGVICPLGHSQSCKQNTTTTTTTVYTRPQSGSACPDPCTEHTTCEKCSARGCSWCCSRSRCGSSGRIACDPVAEIIPGTSCAKCYNTHVDGRNLYEKTFYDSSGFVFTLMIIGSSLAGLVMVSCAIYLMCSCLFRTFTQRRGPSQSLRHHSTVIELDSVEGDTNLDMAVATTTLYGFTADETVGEVPFPVPTQWPPTADLGQCCVCMEAYATVLSCPCGHIAMCEPCTRLIQKRHLTELKTKFRRRKRGAAAIEVMPPPCILCRRPTVGNVLLTRILGPHPLVVLGSLPGVPLPLDE